MSGRYVLITPETSVLMENNDWSVYDLEEDMILDEWEIDGGWEELDRILEHLVEDGWDQSLLKVVLGGAEIGNGDDSAFGPARLITLEEIKKTIPLLAVITAEVLAENFIDEDSLYSFLLSREELLDDIGACFEEVKKAFAEALQQNGNLLFCIE